MLSQMRQFRVSRRDGTTAGSSTGDARVDRTGNSGRFCVGRIHGGGKGRGDGDMVIHSIITPMTVLVAAVAIIIIIMVVVIPVLGQQLGGDGIRAPNQNHGGGGIGAGDRGQQRMIAWCGNTDGGAF